MKRVRRIGVISMVVAAGLVALSVGLATFVLFTTPGGKFALHIANRRGLPVRAQSFQGSLATQFRLFGVTLRTASVGAEVDTLVVSWRPRALREHLVALNDVEVAGARITIHEAGADSAAAAPSHRQTPDTTAVPWSFRAERVRVRRAALAAPGGVALYSIAVDGSGGPDGYQAEVTASGDAGRFHGLRVFVRASGNERGATADSLALRVLGGSVRGGGFLRWSPSLAWNARVGGDSLRVGEVAPAPEEWLGAVSLRAQSTGEIAGDSTRIDVDLASLEGTLRGRPLSARGRVALSGRVVEASDARVTWGSASASLSGRMAERAELLLDANIPSLAEILPRARGAARVKGRLAGTPSRIEVDVTVDGKGVAAANRDIPDLRAVIDATLDAEAYRPHAASVHTGDIRLAGGTLSVRGRASWKHGMEWDVALSADQFETATLAPARWEVRGPLSVRATTSGRRTADGLSGHLELASLSGTFRERPLNGSGTVRVQGHDLDFTSLRLEWGDLHLAADGHYGDPVDLTVDLKAPDLSIIRDDWRGAIVVNGSAQGPLRRPAVDATFTADSLRVRHYAVSHAEGDVDVDPDFNRPAAARVLALGLTTGGTPFDTVRVALDGHRRDHTASLELRRGAMHGAMTARGALVDTVWSGRIEHLRVGHPAAGEWRAQSAVPARATRSSASIDSLVLVTNGARLSARGVWSKGDTTRVAIGLDGFPLATFAHRFPDGTRITGTLGGSADARIDPRGHVTARATLESRPGRITLGGKWLDYSGRVEARATADGVKGSVDVSLTQEEERIALVDGDVAIPGFVIGRDSLGTQPLEGSLDLDCDDIAPLLAVLAPDLAGNAAGTLTARLGTRGNAGDFRIVGDVDLGHARFDLASGLRLRDVAVRFSVDEAGRLLAEGGATSGGGRVSLSASSSRGAAARLGGTFNLNGERFQVLNQPEAQVFVSPAIEVRLSGRNLDITGDVRVPYARIEVAEVPSSAVAQSRDVVFVEDTLATRAPVAVKTRARVVLGDSVTFSGFGLRSRLDGSLVVEDEVGQPTRGTGEINLRDGKYRAYGNDLTIDPGRLVFGGAIDNPGLDIRAYRGLTTQNVMAGSSEMVGVRLEGTLRKPEFSTFSNPPMSESEVLSYLMFGRPMSSGSSSDQAALANAAMILGMSQGNQLAGNLGKQFALDDAYLETGESFKEASFVAGKYLSPKLYVSYATGFFEQTNTFRVRYSLSDSWTLQAENGRYTSSDLLYRFERGK